jgi:methyl-accepting chemotaxis protein
VDQVSAVVQTNSATAEESAAASEELSGQASQLRENLAWIVLRQPAKN